MFSSRLLLGALSLGASIWTARGAVPVGGFEEAGHTQVSALMMFVGSEHSVYILDKAEDNAAQVLGHPAWGSVWDIEEKRAVVQDVRTNVFCASGMHLPNGSWVTFGGNDAVGPGGKPGSNRNPDGTGYWDSDFEDFDGRKAIRVVNPCRITDNLNAMPCKWFDEPEQLGMKRNRWYSAAEPTGTGEIVIVGGFVTGGYINRWYPNTDPAFSGGLSEPTYEFYPGRAGEPRVMDFMVKTSGLNAYAHTYLMPSGLMFVQANLSTVLWNFNDNVETPLPGMPKGVVRVYPASGATAMLPLTPKNGYTPTILFCGGTDMADEMWGDFRYPNIQTWTYPASKDCQRITPEPLDKSQPVAYEQDDDMPIGRSMTQFIALPNGKYLLLNGAEFGTAGYSTSGVKDTPFAQMPFGQSLAGGPVLRPAIYDPEAPRGKRWSQEGLFESKIPRMYHSTAVLLPDGSVFVAGSNPNADVVLNAAFPTEYRADIFYPSYFSAEVRPEPQNVPTKLSYGGQYFDITIPASSYKGSANDAAESVKVTLIRTGFSTHAMQMGQRYLQLENTYTVNKDGSITLHVSQLPRNPNLFQPGPAFLYVNVHDVPSKGTYVIVGSGRVEQQPVGAEVKLPDSVRLDNVQGGTSGNSNAGNNNNGNAGKSDTDGEKSSNTVLIASIAGGAVVLAIIGAIVFVVMRRRRAAEARRANMSHVDLSQPSAGSRTWGHQPNGSEVAFVPYSKEQGGNGWNGSQAALTGGYKDDAYTMGSRDSSATDNAYDPPFDPYAASASGGYPPQPQHQGYTQSPLGYGQVPTSQPRY
ncbi:hypothetical protein CVT24_002239 [Panaeolus cyanescens]|uniref:Galactose oxidase-like Early set domain-containing protein n=1 Tax=Panaeolus cyanescens TaxID=181874 RepID=A0A409YIH1_9AGAR|nr:hypothetical protein CVT24_002239 [Panaeolus cyanescens]